MLVGCYMHVGWDEGNGVWLLTLRPQVSARTSVSTKYPHGCESAWQTEPLFELT
jgi:hypothetical protein